MRKTNYKKYFENFIIDKNTEQKVLETLRNKDLSWPFGVTKDLEQKISQFLRIKYALAHCNATSAMYSAMFAVGVGKSTEVICPTYTFWASIAPAVNLGAKVVFCDIDEDDLLIDTNTIEKYITPKTKAIVIPHLWGRFADIGKIKEVCRHHNDKIFIIEDASHCFGAKYKDEYLSTLGDVGIFSMQAGKSLVAGEGGMLVTNNFEIYDKATYLGHYERIKYSTHTKYSAYSKTGGGYKFRIHPLASAIAISQLSTIKKRLQKQNKLMGYFEKRLQEIPQIQTFNKPYDGYTYGGRFGLRVALKTNSSKKPALIKNGNESGLNFEDEYVSLLHLEKFFKDHDAKNIGVDKFSKTQKLHKRLFSLPIFYSGSEPVIDSYLADLKKILDKSLAG